MGTNAKPATSAAAPPTTPKVSVVLCCYNQAPFVRDAIESVLRQTYQNIELIGIDNGSSDASASIFREYAPNPRVKLFLHTTNAPPTIRFNEGIESASGEFISILYADDYYLPTKIETQTDAFLPLTKDYGIVYSPGYRLNTLTGERWLQPSLTDSGNILKSMIVDYHRVGPINAISPLYRRECLRDYRFHEDTFGEGEAIFYRIAMTYKFKFVPEPSVVMRDHGGNIGKAFEKNMPATILLYERLMQERAFPRELVAPMTDFLARSLGRYGWQGIRVMENPPWARHCFKEALRRQPLMALDLRLAAGFMISLLPVQLIHLMNRAGNRLSPDKAVSAFRSSYTDDSRC